MARVELLLFGYFLVVLVVWWSFGLVVFLSVCLAILVWLCYHMEKHYIPACLILMQFM